MTSAHDPRVVRPVQRPHADRVLICLSYSGGGATKFRAWAATVPERVEVAIICYPGREGRFNTPFAREWSELMEDVVGAIRPLAAHRPYVLFGHSLGGWVAFDAALRMARSGERAPAALVVSACESPVDWAQRPDRTPDPDDPDEALLDWMRSVGQLSPLVVAEPDLREIALALLRADLRVGRSYRYPPDARLELPLQVFYGADDPNVRAGSVDRWRLVTTGPIEFAQLPGAHFYTEEAWASLPTRITALAPSRAALSP